MILTVITGPIGVLMALGTLIGLLAIVKYILNKKEARELQRKLDSNIERQLNDLGLTYPSLGHLAKHSNPEKVASIISSRIKFAIRIGASPAKLFNMLKEFGLTRTIERVNDGEDLESMVKLAALIKNYLMRNIDSHDMKVYGSTVCKENGPGFDLLNSTFLLKELKQNGWVMEIPGMGGPLKKLKVA